MVTVDKEEIERLSSQPSLNLYQSHRRVRIRLKAPNLLSRLRKSGIYRRPADAIIDALILGGAAPEQTTPLPDKSTFSAYGLPIVQAHD